MKTIDRDQLKNMLDRKDDLLVINVLSRDQYENAHIPGSINIPLMEEGIGGDFLEQVFEAAGSYDKRIVTYCASFNCTASTDAAKRLDAAGFKAVFDYKGGIQDWKDAGCMIDGKMRMAA